MDGLFIAKRSIAAPFKMWRLVLRAILPMLPFFVLAVIARFPFDSAADYDRLHPARLGAQVLLWVGIGLFEWNWLGLLREPQSSWRDRLCGQKSAVIAFVTVSWVLLGIFSLIEPVQAFVQSYDPIVNHVGEKIYYATSFRTAGLCLLLWIVLCWLRLRLLLWPVDIFASGRPTLPSNSWRMTRRQLRELVFMVIAIAVSIGTVGGLIIGMGYAVLGKISYVIGFPALLWYFAALDHAFLECHRELQPGARGTNPILAAAQS